MEPGRGLATGQSEIGSGIHKPAQSTAPIRTEDKNRKGNQQVDQPTVLVISDDVEFSRSITARWQMERNVPMFTMLSGDFWPRCVDNFSVAIVGPRSEE